MCRVALGNGPGGSSRAKLIPSSRIKQKRQGIFLSLSFYKFTVEVNPSKGLPEKTSSAACPSSQNAEIHKHALALLHAQIRGKEMKPKNLCAEATFPQNSNRDELHPYLQIAFRA